jgi:capsular exopolysaccharide synthesis family protein
MESREAVDIHLIRYLSGLKRRWLPALIIFAATFTCSALFTTLLKPSYEAEGKLLFKVPPFKITGATLNGADSESDLKPLVSSQNPITTEIEVISSPRVLEKTIKELHLINKQGLPLKADELKKSLTFKIIGGTDVLRVTYTSRNPKEASAVVNKLMSVYIDNDIYTSRYEAEFTHRLITKQLAQPQAAVHRAELALRRFKEGNQIANLSEEAKLAVGLISNLDAEIVNVRSELAQVTAQNNALRNKVALDGQQAIAASNLSQSPAVQGIVKQLQEIERQLATESSRFQNDNPIIIDLEQKKANLQSLLKQHIEQINGSQTKIPQGLLQIGELKQTLIKDFLQSEDQRLSLAQKLASLNNSRAAYERRLKNIPQLEQTQRQLEQNLEVADSTYQNLLKKTQELQVAENKNTSNARIISQALVPEKPSSGKEIIVLVIGVLFGALLSVSTVLVLEARDRSLKTLGEIREIFGYKLLGIVPLSTKNIRSRYRDAKYTVPEIAIRDTPYSLTSDIYRMIQANLNFLSSDKVLKSIVVTSTDPKEGKSTVAANLAAALAQKGYAVLLIDADMRSPFQHHIWQLANIGGLSDLLLGQSKSNASVCKVMNNLDILTAGAKPLNPISFLDSKMASIIEYYSLQYDYVIIDAPTLLLNADAITLSQMTDGTLLVARPGVTDASNAKAAQEMLERASHNVLGLVVNAAIEKKDFNFYLYPSQKYHAVEALMPKDRVRM